MSFLPLVRLWLWISALATAAGWLLSALGQLNGRGYLAVCFLAVLLVWFGRRIWGWSSQTVASCTTERHPLDPTALSWRKFLGRLSRPLPLAFVFLSVLVL